MRIQERMFEGRKGVLGENDRIVWCTEIVAELQVLVGDGYKRQFAGSWVHVRFTPCR